MWHRIQFETIQESALAPGVDDPPDSPFDLAKRGHASRWVLGTPTARPGYDPATEELRPVYQYGRAYGVVTESWEVVPRSVHAIAGDMRRKRQLAELSKDDQLTALLKAQGLIK